MPIEIVNRRRSLAAIAAEWPEGMVLDLTSRGPQPWVQLSPFYPHGGIPVPMTPGATGQSVEGIWQALKVFENTDVDPSKLRITSMRNIKRTTRRFGRVLGHRAGLAGDTLLAYEDARRQIYLPTYRWVLDNKVAELIDDLRNEGQHKQVILLDYTTNGDLEDLSKPLSHAALVAMCAEDRWPSEG